MFHFSVWLEETDTILANGRNWSDKAHEKQLVRRKISQKAFTMLQIEIQIQIWHENHIHSNGGYKKSFIHAITHFHTRYPCFTSYRTKL